MAESNRPEREKQVGGATGHGFKPGQSGNPGGRPKGAAEVSALAQKHTPDAIRTLVSIANGKKSPAAARVSAAVAILDRGWGKPAQAIQQLGALGEPIDPASSVVVTIDLKAALEGWKPPEK